MDLTETTLQSERLYKGVLLDVRRDVARLPDGGEGVREWIHHLGAAAVVPLFANGDTMLIRQFRYAPRREFLEVPAGKLDREGEDPEDVARRELEEEVGLKTSRLTPLGPTYPCIGYSDETIHLYLAEELEEVENNEDHDEFVVPVRMPLEEALRRARAGELLDTKSVVALVRAAAHLDSR